MEVENLIKQREALDTQISDIKTAEVRKKIAELNAVSKDLTQKRNDAKAYQKTADLEIVEQIAFHRAEIERLSKMSLGNLHKVSSIEFELQRNGVKFSEQKQILDDLLAE